MDERVFQVKTGEPIPSWDLMHRLPISGCVGPECKDSATVYQINSTFMDVTDQPHMMRHWLAGGILTALLVCMVCLAFSIALMSNHFPLVKGPGLYFNAAMCFGFALGFLYFAWRFGRDEIFSLTSRPIRFNRLKNKLYAIRRRRFFSSDGDVIWEIPWSDEVFFCIHKGPKNTDHRESYHIRCYQVDARGIVSRGFAIGREWQQLDGLNDLLCQWNYWCHYMNEGPSDLPKPLLFLTEKENFFESFLYCMYEAGFGLSVKLRLVFFPFFCWMAIHRIVSLLTCRSPIWPRYVQEFSKIEDDDAYREPIGSTPIGWATTSQARLNNSYPLDPRMPTPRWGGDKDGFKNAERWGKDIGPGGG